MSDSDTKKKIVEAGTYLFGVKGYDGTSTREIAHRAGVNIASLNYHFKSKQGLLQEVVVCIMDEFKKKVQELGADANSASDYAVKIFETFTEDSSKFLNHFKLFLDATSHTCDVEPQPIGYEQLSFFLRKELKPTVPEAEIAWAVSVLFNYIMHTALMSATEVGKKHIEKFLPKKKATIPVYIQQLVEALIRDLNLRY